ncbi:MAG TPA: glycosyltransferase family 4 protein [Victivallales bacterium]|nr:glycosyltransferase family 4 protein [Victivallales bacterium]
MKKIETAWIETGRGLYGGQIYNSIARKAIEPFCNVEHILVRNKILPGSILGNIEILSRLMMLAGQRDVWIREIPALITMNKKRTKGAQVALIHHDDFSGYNSLKRFALAKLWKKGLENLKNCDQIVTVSEFWRDYYQSRGLKNLNVIYNAFNMEDYDISEDSALDFARKYDLADKPIVYIGNCQKAKGVLESYQALKDLDVHLVSSGLPLLRTPARNLLIEYQDYLKLLKAASVVVAMSKFDEGWCRTAHEAMLLKTPVVGSGRGGMKELLNGGGQTVCSDFRDLKKIVMSILESDQKAFEMGQSGYGFARKFTISRMSSGWKEVMEKTVSCNA